jgi:hypothetical protein
MNRGGIREMKEWFKIIGIILIALSIGIVISLFLEQTCRPNELYKSKVFPERSYTTSETMVIPDEDTLYFVKSTFLMDTDNEVVFLFKSKTWKYMAGYKTQYEVYPYEECWKITEHSKELLSIGYVNKEGFNVRYWFKDNQVYKSWTYNQPITKIPLEITLFGEKYVVEKGDLPDYQSWLSEKKILETGDIDTITSTTFWDPAGKQVQAMMWELDLPLAEGEGVYHKTFQVLVSYWPKKELSAEFYVDHELIKDGVCSHKLSRVDQIPKKDIEFFIWRFCSRFGSGGIWEN